MSVAQRNQYSGESYAEKAERKFRENPAVPIGALATTMALTMAMFKMRAGNAKSFNNWLRMRVLFQGLTIAALCAGTYNIGFKKSVGVDQAEEDAKEELRRREEKAGRERLEFEERMKAAEEMHESEVRFGEQVKARKEARQMPVTSTSATTSAVPPTQPPQRSSGGWKSWLGW